MARVDLTAQLASLETLTSPALRKRWTGLTGRPAPRLSPKLLRLALAWELQAAVHGGHSRRTQQRLEQLASGKTRTQRTRPGMRLVREWNGTLHTVTIDEDGTIHWNERTWNSLSEIARTITGTRWSGPAFFGLKHKRKAA